MNTGVESSNFSLWHGRLARVKVHEHLARVLSKVHGRDVLVPSKAHGRDARATQSKD